MLERNQDAGVRDRDGGEVEVRQLRQRSLEYVGLLARQGYAEPASERRGPHRLCACSDRAVSAFRASLNHFWWDVTGYGM